MRLCECRWSILYILHHFVFCSLIFSSSSFSPLFFGLLCLIRFIEPFICVLIDLCEYIADVCLLAWLGLIACSVNTLNTDSDKKHWKNNVMWCAYVHSTLSYRSLIFGRWEFLACSLSTSNCFFFFFFSL